MRQYEVQPSTTSVRSQGVRFVVRRGNCLGRSVQQRRRKQRPIREVSWREWLLQCRSRQSCIRAEAQRARWSQCQARAWSPRAQWWSRKSCHNEASREVWRQCMEWKSHEQSCFYRINKCLQNLHWIIMIYCVAEVELAKVEGRIWDLILELLRWSHIYLSKLNF